MRGVVGALMGMVLALGVGMAGPAGAQEAPPLSPGCQELNDPKYDAVYSQLAVTAVFFVGETITVTAEAPPVSGDPDTVGLVARNPDDDSEVFFRAVASYPGTATRIIPETRSIEVLFGVFPFASDFITVTCTAAPYPLAVNVAGPALVGQHASMLLPLDDSSDSSASTLISVGVLMGIVAVQVVGVSYMRRRQTPEG